jgi:hypothetical protein
MNKNQIACMEHALRNQNRYYTEHTDADWNDLAKKGFASKHTGWEPTMAYFHVTAAGKKALGELV